MQLLGYKPSSLKGKSTHFLKSYIISLTPKVARRNVLIVMTGQGAKRKTRGDSRDVVFIASRGSKARESI